MRNIRFIEKRFKKLLNNSTKSYIMKHCLHLEIPGGVLLHCFHFLLWAHVLCPIIKEYQGQIFCHCLWWITLIPQKFNRAKQISLHVHIDHSMCVCVFLKLFEKTKMLICIKIFNLNFLLLVRTIKYFNIYDEWMKENSASLDKGDIGLRFWKVLWCLNTCLRFNTLWTYVKWKTK